MKLVAIIVLSLATLLGAGSILAADSYPLFQSALVDKSGVVKFIQTIENKPVQREARDGDPWIPGEKLSVDKGRGYAAKIAISDLALISFDGGSHATLIQGAGHEGMAPPQIQLEQGVFFYKMKKGASRPLRIKAGPLKVETSSGAGYVKFLGDKFQAICGGGSLTVTDKKRNTVGKGRGYSCKVSRKRGSTKKLPSSVMKKLAKAFRVKLPDKKVPTLPDKIPPVITIVTPKEGQAVNSGTVEVAGAVNDPSVEKIKVMVQNESRGLKDVNAGEFRFRVKLYEKRNTIIIIAEDNNRNEGASTVVVPCKKPLAKPKAEKTDEPKGGLQSALAKVKKALTDPSNPMMFIGCVLAGGLLLFIGYLIVRKVYLTSKKSLQKASELATGIVFQRCEKCGNREYHYHLFYTTESVNSPFLRNMINNVNPMATSMMNESLESLLSTGLKWSQKAKQAENKIRVICSWCDFCKTGTLSLEHMQGDAVTKVDDYQIIHPIFIEWVRKVYD